MESGNYKLIDERLLSKEDILKGMDFEHVLKIKLTPKFPLKNWIIGGVAVVTIAAFFFIGNNDKKEKLDHERNATPIEIRRNDTIVPKQENSKEISKEIVQIKAPLKKDSAVSLDKPKVTELVEEYSDAPFVTPRSLPFKKRFNTDAETAITIKDSIYGPTNVSIGRGDYCEFNDPNEEKAVEKNSAWFKFTIKKDTLLTFHIVPTLKTDDYDFVLFKCDDYSCLSEMKRGKAKPIRYSFAWNTTHNINTGLSNNRRDTTWQNETYYKNWTGKTYAPSLKVKAGETFYLMITISNIDTQNKEPEGFMIYFYRNLPKQRANTYNPKYGK
jgi:hypothetical protein